MAARSIDVRVRAVTTNELLREEIACLRLLRAVAVQERDDANADAATFKAERDDKDLCIGLLEEQRERIRRERDSARSDARIAHLALNETATLLRAARHVGRDQEKELAEQRAHIAALSADEFDVVTREQELISRIDTYQCEIEGLKAELAEWKEGMAAAVRSTFDPRLMP